MLSGLKMLTAIAPPTAALPLIASAPETARFCSAKLFVALTVSVSVESTFAPTPIFAVVSKSTYMTPIDAATPTSDFPPPAARPQTTKSLRSLAGVIASTVMPAPLRVAWSPMIASFSAMSTLSPTAAPTFASPPDDVRAMPVAFAVAST